MAILDSYKNSTLGLKGSTPEPTLPAYKQVFKVNDPTPGLQGDEVYNVKSELDLDGKSPKILPSALKSSATHVFDPKPGVGGNEQYRVKSTLDLKGKTPTQATYPNHVFDPKNDPNKLALSDEITILYKSNLDLDGKTPDTLPSALRSSATHVYDPDFSISQASDPLLNLRGQALAIAQRNRRSNNTITYDSALDLDGKTPNKSKDTSRSENVKSEYGLDGKTPPTYRDNAPENVSF